MKDVVEALRKSKKVFLGGKADVHHNIDARKYLAEQGMAVFPDEFFLLVKYINGMRDDSAQIYGILPEGSNLGLEDAVRENERLDRRDMTLKTSNTSSATAKRTRFVPAFHLCRRHYEEFFIFRQYFCQKVLTPWRNVVYCISLFYVFGYYSPLKNFSHDTQWNDC